jgi:hypothetical protein
VINALLLALIVPRLQMSSVQVPWLVDMDESAALTGSVSVTITPVAVAGPVLLIVIV